MKYTVTLEKIMQAKYVIEACSPMAAMKETEMQMFLCDIKPIWREVQQYAKDVDDTDPN